MVSHYFHYFNIQHNLSLYPARTLIDKNPNYKLLTNNCQHFVKALALYIIDPTLVEPEFGARYRFTRYHLMATKTFQHTGPKAGWIFPSAETILVNVTKVKDDQEVWQGEVEGSGEYGMFLRAYWCRRIGVARPFDAANIHHPQATL